MPYTVGLTGGIGSGKSVVASLFEKLGANLVDTDVIAHQLTVAGGAAIPAIQAQFGTDFLNADGSLNRSAMRQRVFSDSKAKQALENILHPMIHRQVGDQIATSQAPYVMLAVPLLVETGAYRDRIERVVVVDCNEDLQLTRTAARSKLSASEIKAVMATQVPRAERLRHADDIILNNGELGSLSIPVAVIDQRLRALATAPSAPTSKLTSSPTPARARDSDTTRKTRLTIKNFAKSPQTALSNQRETVRLSIFNVG